jgi:flagellar biosynthesis/type III secretory pathway M-ring protein FliF/YscJ
MKKLLLICINLIVLLGCSPKENTQDKFIIWGNGSNVELNASLITRLEDAKIEYKVDSENNVLIKEKDSKKAVICCS